MHQFVHSFKGQIYLNYFSTVYEFICSFLIFQTPVLIYLFNVQYSILHSFMVHYLCYSFVYKIFLHFVIHFLDIIFYYLFHSYTDWYNAGSSICNYYSFVLHPTVYETIYSLNLV